MIFLLGLFFLCMMCFAVRVIFFMFKFIAFIVGCAIVYAMIH